MKIEDGLIVLLSYELIDAQGKLFESSTDDGPLSYMQGNEEIPPPVELALEGAVVGTKLEVEVTAAEAYGEHDVEGIFSIPQSDFPEGPQLIPGEWIQLNVTPEEGETGAGETMEIEARVVEINDDAVVLDTNHPLAGQDVVFKLEVLEVREPTEDDLEPEDDPKPEHDPKPEGDEGGPDPDVSA